MKTTLKISAALAAAALSAAIMGYSTTANAVTKSLDMCHGPGRGTVEQCCKTWVKRNGRPFWMNENNMSCTSAVICQTNWSGGPSICQIDFTPPNHGGHDNPTPPKGTPPDNPPPNNPPSTAGKLP